MKLTDDDLSCILHDFEHYNLAIGTVDATVLFRFARAIEAAVLAAHPPAQDTQDAKDAARFRYLNSRAYEAVIRNGEKLNGSRTAWATHLYAGPSYAEAIDADIGAKTVSVKP